MANGLYDSFFWSEAAVSLTRGSEKGAMGGSAALRRSLSISTVSPGFARSVNDVGLYSVSGTEAVGEIGIHTEVHLET